MSSQTELTVNKYFGDLISPSRMYAKRLDNFSRKFEFLLTHYEAGHNDRNHPFFLISDFLFFADEYLSKPNPISLRDLREVAKNISEGHMDLVESLRLDALKGDTIHFSFDPTDFRAQINNSQSSFSILETAVHDAKVGLGQVALKELHRVHSEDLRVQAEISQQQLENFQVWLGSRDAKVFFECYMTLRMHEYTKTHNRQKRLNNV